MKWRTPATLLKEKGTESIFEYVALECFNDRKIDFFEIPSCSRYEYTYDGIFP